MNTLKKIKAWVAVMSVMGLVAAPALLPIAASAQAPCVNPKDCLTKGSGTVQTGRTNLQAVFTDVTNILLFVLGAIAVIMLVIGGIKYTTSNGNAEQIKSAKNTIMYAIVGLVVAVLAYAVVNFVVDSLLA